MAIFRFKLVNFFDYHIVIIYYTNMHGHQLVNGYRFCTPVRRTVPENRPVCIDKVGAVITRWIAHMVEQLT